MEYYAVNDFRGYLAHHGIKGQKWGVKNGPPYPLDAGDHNARERKANWKSSLNKGGEVKRKKKTGTVITSKTLSNKETRRKEVAKKKQERLKEDIKNNQIKYGLSYQEAAKLTDKQKKMIKAALIATGIAATAVIGYKVYKTVGQKYFDTVIKPGTTLQNLHYGDNVNLARGYIYESHKKLDTMTYKSLFAKKHNAKNLRNLTAFKTKDAMKIASEHNSKKIFKDLYKKDAEFRKYVNEGMDLTDIKTKGSKNPIYKELISFYEKNKGKDLNEKQLNNIFKMYNYTLPNTDLNSVLNRNKYFDALRKAGYSGIIDTNDSIYGHYKTRQSNIVFDLPKLSQEYTRNLTYKDVVSSGVPTIGRQVLVEFGGFPILTAAGSYWVYNKSFQKELEKAIENTQRHER